MTVLRNKVHFWHAIAIQKHEVCALAGGHALIARFRSGKPNIGVPYMCQTQLLGLIRVQYGALMIWRRSVVRDDDFKITVSLAS